MEEIILVNGDNNYDILHMGKDAFDWVVLMSDPNLFLVVVVWCFGSFFLQGLPPK